MKSRLSLLALLLLGSRSLLAAGDPPVKGAKELFYDPTDGAVVSASQPNAFTGTPPPSSNHPKKVAGAPKKAGSAGATRLAHTEPTNSSSMRRVLNKAASNSSTLGLSYWIELVGRDGKGQQVTDSRTFHSGEKIRLHFRSNAEGYIALIQLGSSGTSSILFPDPVRGLTDSRIAADSDRILPTDKAWFKFDNSPGTERIVVLFGRAQQDLDSFQVKPRMDAPTTEAVLRGADKARGSKDLILETETENASEVGTYAVNLAGKPVVLDIQLRHE